MQQIDTVKTDFLENEEDSEQVRSDSDSDLSVGLQKVVVFHPKGNQFVTGGTDGKARVWDFPTLKLQNTLEVSSKTIEEIDFDVEGNFV